MRLLKRTPGVMATTDDEPQDFTTDKKIAGYTRYFSNRLAVIATAISDAPHCGREHSAPDDEAPCLRGAAFQTTGCGVAQPTQR